jgi:MEDS: MEthanogen/methylotroph, DcmR Sensory domain
MASESGTTDISSVDHMPWGTHFCLFYETQQDLQETLVPYFRASLEANQCCIWVVSQPFTRHDAIGALRQAIPDLDRHLEQRSIEILSHDQWYLQNGVVDRDRVLRSWKQQVTEAVADTRNPSVETNESKVREPRYDP